MSNLNRIKYISALQQTYQLRNISNKMIVSALKNKILMGY